MKNVNFLLCTVLIIINLLSPSSYVKAQTTVQIGSGTDVSLSTLYSPVYRFSSASSATTSRSKILFTQPELTNAGVVQGAKITSLQFNKIGDSYFTSPAVYNMYMANSSDTSLPDTTSWSSILSSHTNVYSNNSFNVPAAAGWVTWNLSNPFIYTGGSLTIATDLIMPGSGGTTGTTFANGNLGAFQWQYTSATPANYIAGASGTSAPATLNGNNAFYLHRPNVKITFTPGTLPVKLVNITAVQEESNILLKWTTAAESNFSYFDIERSLDGISYVKAGKLDATITASGNNAYGFTDTNNANTIPANKTIFYRLKMVDKDGRFEYSKVVTVKFTNGKTEIVFVYPNPFNSVTNIKLKLEEPSTIKFTITDITGRIILEEPSISLREGEYILPLSVSKSVSKGAYFLKTTANGKIIVSKLIKR